MDGVMDGMIHGMPDLAMDSGMVVTIPASDMGTVDMAVMAVMVPIGVMAAAFIPDGAGVVIITPVAAAGAITIAISGNRIIPGNAVVQTLQETEEAIKAMVHFLDHPVLEVRSSDAMVTLHQQGISQVVRMEL
jgi:hypothetical protein